MQIVEPTPRNGGVFWPAAGHHPGKPPRKPATKPPAPRNKKPLTARSAGGADESTRSTPAIEPNRLLAALEPDTRDLLIRASEAVTLQHRYVAYKPLSPITHVYFPRTAVFSMVREMMDGSGIEVGTIGREGIVGGGVVVGATSMSTRCIVQIPGNALRIPTVALNAAVRRSHLDDAEPGNGSAVLWDVLQRYAQVLFEQVTQTAACNRLHALEQRCARWLLMTHDRVDGDELALTQEFLSYMLGVRRAGVTEACGTLQRSALIRYRHGHITILDRPGLEAVACECYAVAGTAYEQLLGN